MNPKETRELIAEARRMAPFYDKSGTLEVARILERLADALAVLSAPQEAKPGTRLAPDFRASLVDIAKGSIQAVWDDVPDGVDAETLAQNVVGAQEFAWIARGFPVTPQEGDARERLHAKCDCVPELGPEHCHLCSDREGHEVAWAECSSHHLDRERVKTWLQREFGSVLAHDPHNPERFWGGSARALCEAAKRGELT